MSSDELVFGSCPLPIFEHDEILLGHGGGGTLTAELIEGLMVPAFSNPTLDLLGDQAQLDFAGGRVAFTTDGFVISPIFFPGGDIGRLAIHGTVNDLAMGGAQPLFLAVGFILEEGLAIDELRRVVDSMREAVAEVGVQVVTGDTKVVGRGQCDKLFITTTGIGTIPDGVNIAPDRARPGDAILVSGTLGDHGMAILATREGLGLESQIVSDSQPLHDLVGAMLAASPRIHVLRDPTRGGLATVLDEIASQSNTGIEIDEDTLPVRDEVRGACEILGFDPLHVANEGKLVAMVPPEDADTVLAAMQAHPRGRDAVRIGTVVGDHPGVVMVRNPIGGSRILDRPYGELLPRIC